MAHERGATGSGDGGGQESRAAGGGPDVPDAPELWGDNGLVGEGRYRLTHRLGRGGMAEVFAAEDLRLGRTVAVKLLRADLANDETSKARFTREAQSVAGLNHPAVVAVYDSGEEFMRLGGGQGTMVPYIVMELVKGRTIRDLLMNAEAPPPEQALIIVSGVLEALAYSHQHGIVHRDIKPANVIITDTGAVKVMDFGIARALHGVAQTMTATGMVMGTPQYLSPEQALGRAVDTRSDLYAVGCLLYELLALRPPFVGETPLSVVYQHVQDTPRLPSELNPKSPPELDGLVLRSLAKEPDDRFQTAEEMRGVVRYALRMLREHGSHTNGLWNTGPVTDPTPAAGTAGAGRARRASAATEATAPTGVATTSEISPPMLLGDPDAGGPDGDGGAGGRSRRGRLVLVALAAVVAIGTGVLVAANLNGGDDGGTDRETVDSTQTATNDLDDEDSGGDQHGDPGDSYEDSTGDGGDGVYPSGTADSDQLPEETAPSPTETLPDYTPTESETWEEPTQPEDPTPPSETDEETDPELPTDEPTESEPADPTPTDEDAPS